MAAGEAGIETMDTRSSCADLPLLRDLQRADRREPRIAANLRLSGARRSTALIVLFHAGTLLLGSVLAALLLESVDVALAITTVGCVLVAVGSTGRFRTRMVPDLAGHLPRLAISVAAGASVPLTVLVAVGQSMTSFRAFAALVAVQFCCVLFATWAAVSTTRRLWASGLMRSRAVILGSGPLSREFAVELRLRPEYGVDLVEVVEISNRGTLADELVEAVYRTDADRVIIAPLEEEHGDGRPLVHAARRTMGLGIPVYVVPRLHELGLGLDSMSPDRARGYPLVRIQRSAHPTLTLRTKRVVDVVVSGSLLLLLGPIMAAAAVAVKLTSAGPVLFRQPRVGRRGREFDMLKFRSMIVSDNEHSERTSEHRVTAVGRVLRATSVDELPQLWNILIGEMSLVGARPERLSFVEEGLGMYEGYADRHRMPMGLTGLAQVAGLRGEDTSVQERVKFDNLYIDQWSLSLDLQILLQTAFAILFQGKYRYRERQLTDAITSLQPDTELRAVVDLRKPVPQLAEREMTVVR